jgi:hypothetical protein
MIEPSVFPDIIKVFSGEREMYSIHAMSDATVLPERIAPSQTVIQPLALILARALCESGFILDLSIIQKTSPEIPNVLIGIEIGSENNFNKMVVINHFNTFNEI